MRETVASEFRGYAPDPCGSPAAPPRAKGLVTSAPSARGVGTAGGGNSGCHMQENNTEIAIGNSSRVANHRPMDHTRELFQSLDASEYYKHQPHHKSGGLGVLRARRYHPAPASSGSAATTKRSQSFCLWDNGKRVPAGRSAEPRLSKPASSNPSPTNGSAPTARTFILVVCRRLHQPTGTFQGRTQKPFIRLASILECQSRLEELPVALSLLTGSARTIVPVHGSALQKIAGCLFRRSVVVGRVYRPGNTRR